MLEVSDGVWTGEYVVPPSTEAFVAEGTLLQGSGKKRPIDDGARSRVNECMAFHEKLSLCTALSPCAVARLLRSEPI